jgi:hypothetical protein
MRGSSYRAIHAARPWTGNDIAAVRSGIGERCPDARRVSNIAAVCSRIYKRCRTARPADDVAAICRWIDESGLSGRWRHEHGVASDRDDG